MISNSWDDARSPPALAGVVLFGMEGEIRPSVALRDASSSPNSVLLDGLVVTCGNGHNGLRLPTQN